MGAIKDAFVTEFTPPVPTSLDDIATAMEVVIETGVDHGGLSGLGDDDHLQYLRTDSTRAGTGTQQIAEVGVGTATVPHDGVGAAKLAIDGTDSNVSGPHLQTTTASDSYPLLQLLSWAHDSIDIVFDAYFDGAWKSSDAGSNFKISKFSDKLKIQYDSSESQGDTLTWNDGFTMDASGNVGISQDPRTAIETPVLDVAAGEIVTARVTLTQDTGSSNPTWHLDNNADVLRIFRQADIVSGGAVKVYITTTKVGLFRSPTTNALEVNGDASKSSSGSWLANSDRRIKQYIEPIKNALVVISKLRPVSFAYKDDYKKENPSVGDHDYHNFIAQEFAEVFPDFVSETNDEQRTLQIDTYPVRAHLVAAVQELNGIVEKQQDQINSLEKRLDALEAKT